jgi:serine/threonine-protein kinase
MAQVWEGRDEVLDRPVALKLLHPHLAADEAFLARFRQEAVAAARLAHPNVVATFDTGVDAGVAYIVMELLPGRTLRQVVDEEGPLSPARVVSIGVQVADALGHAHACGLVHRDVKPGNVLCGDDGRVKVADFGIAKAAQGPSGPLSGGLGADLTEAGTVLGTAKYLAPEQVRGEPADARTDVYALGLVLYELLCGRVPFSAATDRATALQRLAVDPLRPRQVRAGIPRSLETVVLRAIARRPDDRYPTAAELRTALLAVDVADDDATAMVARDSTPPAGTPPTFAQSERSWLVPTAVILVVAVALGVGGVLFARTDVGQDLLRSTKEAFGSGRTEAATIVGADAFDPPPGRGSENDGQLRLLFDSNSATAWSTEGYNNRRLGGLKPGVGVVLRLDKAHPLGKLEVSSPTRGWAAEVYVAATPKDTLAGWGQPVASRRAIPGSVAFDLDGTEGAAVLLWITDLGDGPPRVRVEIGEVRFTA